MLKLDANLITEVIQAQDLRLEIRPRPKRRCHIEPLDGHHGATWQGMADMVDMVVLVGTDQQWVVVMVMVVVLVVVVDCGGVVGSQVFMVHQLRNHHPEMCSI